jgi:N-methylhydantoinase A
MANAVRAVTTERGLDPREFALFAYGGNGPLHVCLVARELGITQVVVPRIPAVFAALGMLMADLRTEVVRTRVDRLDALTVEELDARYRELEQECLEALDSSGKNVGKNMVFLRAADMRYVGQEHSIRLPIPPLSAPDGLDALKRAFDAAHLERFAHGAPDEPAEVVSLRVSLVRTVSRPEPEKIAFGAKKPPAAACLGSRPMVLDSTGSPRDCPILARSALLAGNLVHGPAAIVEDSTTTLLRPGDRCEVDPYGNLLITIGGAQ